MNDNSTSAGDDNMDSNTDYSHTLYTFAAVMTFTIMVVGMTGNILTVLALIKCPKVRNVAAAFIISLCTADLLFCALVLPFSALRFIYGSWTHGEFLCKLIPFIQYGNIGVSLLCIGMITINRYVMIAHHSSYLKIYQKHWIALMIAFCWLFSYGMLTPTFLGEWGTFGYDEHLRTCSIMNDEDGHSSKSALFIIAFVIPCIIIIICYTKIFWVIHESEARLKKHANKQNSIPNNLRAVTTATSSSAVIANNTASDSSYSTDNKLDALQKQSPSRVKDQRESRSKRNEWRITKMVLAIFLSFVVCYLPITIAKVADKDAEHQGFQVFSYIMLYLSACINPIIYVIMNKQYRKAYKTVIMCEPAKLLHNLGKTLGGSSVPEKLKDTALSHNHSRTMVSQMSGGDPANTSLSSSQVPASTTIEMIATPNSTLPTTPTKTTANISDSMTTTATADALSPVPFSEITTTPPVSTVAKRSPSKEHNRITLVGGDVIMEEEEEEEEEVLNEQTATQLPAHPLAEAPSQCPSEEMIPAVIPVTKSVYVNVAEILPKRIPYYGQNINAIPDNNNVDAKLSTTKLKIEKDFI